MNQNSKLFTKKLIGFCLVIGILILATLPMRDSSLVSAQGEEPPLQETEYFRNEKVTLSDGTVLYKATINGPRTPPIGIESSRVNLRDPIVQASAVTLTDVPAFDWVFGCSAVSGAMIAGYYDRHGFPNIYTGPTNSGVVPLDSSIWGTWWDSEPYEYPNNPLVASRKNSDGRETLGSIDDYWIMYGNADNDPYITGSWTQHTWSDAVGDYMKTSQSAYGNSDASTSFYYSQSSPLTCAAIESYGGEEDGTLGYGQFFEARGYALDQCYIHRTDNVARRGGFTLAQYKAQIDAGHPVMIHVQGHTMVGFGYDTASNTIYIHDTWDYLDHSMTWGGSYSGMSMWAVSIVYPILPTAVELLSFTATGAKKSVILNWETATEMDNLGFNLYRATSADGERTKINNELIPSTFPGGLEGASYSYVDINLRPKKIYYYWLEDVDVRGNTELNGPVVAETTSK